MNSTRTPAVPEKRLERACNYVSDLWFPANPTLVAKLQSTLRFNTEESDIEEILKEVRGDFALFTFCLKGLFKLLKQEGADAPSMVSPIELLRWAGVSRLKQILEVNDQSISRHFFDGMNSEQKQRLQEAVVSASAAQVLATESNIDPELGYSSALLRQLGHTLIAWNYPGVYQKALHTMREENTTLDIAITQLLGFSPTTLAVTLARSWGLAQELCEAIEDEESAVLDELAFDDLTPTESIGHSLAQLCRVGEALARANNPDLYPSAEHDWEFARTAIAGKLGPDGLRLIQEAIVENSEQYVVSIPHFFKGGTILDPELQLLEHEKSTLLSRNPFLEKCRPQVKKKLNELYEAILNGQQTQETLKILTREVIPISGFSGGCVYTVEPSSETLVPQLAIGGVKLREVLPVACSLNQSSSDPIALAFKADEPITREHVCHHDAIFAAIAGVLGHAQRIGVLYLELPQVAFEGSDQQHLVHFKALSAALNDCLNIAS